MDNYKINIDLTKELLEQKDNDPVYAQAIIDRHIEAVEYFQYHIEGRVLELGCRDGTLFDVLYDYDLGDSYFGIDISKDALIQAKQKGYNVKFLPMENVSELLSKYDTVICLHALEHSIDPEKTVKGIYDVCNESAKILIEVPMQKKEPVPTKWGHYTCFSTEEEVIDLFKEFKHIVTFSNSPKTWRRFVFQKESNYNERVL